MRYVFGLLMAVCLIAALGAPAAHAQDRERVERARACAESLVSAFDRDMQAASQVRTRQDMEEWMALLGRRVGTMLGWQISSLTALAARPDEHMVDAVIAQCLEHPSLK